MRLRPSEHIKVFCNDIGLDPWINDVMFILNDSQQDSGWPYHIGTPRDQRRDSLIVQIVKQRPKRNSVEAVWWVIQILPGLVLSTLLAAGQIQTKKHVTDKNPLHSPSKELKIFTAHRPDIQQLGISLILEMLRE